MGNPVRPWDKFLLAWEKLELEAQIKYVNAAYVMVKQLRLHQKDITQRLTYWEANLANARKARRNLENVGRSREIYNRDRRNKDKPSTTRLTRALNKVPE